MNTNPSPSQIRNRPAPPQHVNPAPRSGAVRQPVRKIDADPSLEELAKNGAVGYVMTKRTSYGNENETLDEVRVPVFHAKPAVVRVSGSVTRNLGDYNSARVEVSVEMPCLPEHSEIERVYLLLSEQVDTMCRRELAIATGQPMDT